MFNYQFKVIARDGRVNEQSGVADVTVRIARDEQPPRFTNQPFVFRVSENLAPNTSFDVVTASDPDLQVRATLSSCVHKIRMHVGVSRYK